MVRGEGRCYFPRKLLEFVYAALLVGSIRDSLGTKALGKFKVGIRFAARWMEGVDKDGSLMVCVLNVR